MLGVKAASQSWYGNQGMIAMMGHVMADITGRWFACVCVRTSASYLCATKWSVSV